MSQLRPLIAGNWKMNGLKASLGELGIMADGYAQIWPKVDLLVCLPATLIYSAAAVVIGSRIRIGAQDCHAEDSGAHTGDISAQMLADAGAGAVIVGHSERRAGHAETDAIVRAKTEAAWRAGLTAIVCVGETQEQRDGGKALDIVGNQLDGSVPAGATALNAVIAYEPIWAIGTGRTPTAADVAQMHAFLRERLAERFDDASRMRLLYGGSVKPGNAAELMAVPNVDGALVGGASLKAADFLRIAAACI